MSVQDTQILPFRFESLPLRTLNIDGEAWFVATDLAKALDYQDARHMTRILDEDEVSTYRTPGSLKGAELSIINESGIYHAIFASTKPEAKQFRNWVTKEVLPSIRKQGYYLSQDATPAQIAQLQADLSSAQHKLELHKEMAQEATLDARALQIKAAALEEAVDEFFAYSELQERTAHAIRMNWGEVLAKLTQDIRHARGKVNRLLQEAGVPDLQDREIAGCGKAA